MKIFDWVQWTSDCRLAVDTEDDAAAAAARRAVSYELESVERVMNRWVKHSEISLINDSVRARGSVSCKVSDTLAFLIMQALYSYDFTDGAFDPRVEDSLQALGYGPGLESLDLQVTSGGRLVCQQTGSLNLHDQVQLNYENQGWLLTTSATLDLTAIGKACAADFAAEAAAEVAQAPVLLSLGGDISTAGTYYSREKNPGWAVVVEDLLGDPQAVVELINNGAIATSSSQKRTWGEASWHHIIDPRTGLSAESDLKTASVIAETAAVANVLATAAIVWGRKAKEELAQRNCAARLVTAQNLLIHHNWPENTEQGSDPELAGASRD